MEMTLIIVFFNYLIALKNAHNTMLSEKYMPWNRIYGMVPFCLQVVTINIIDWIQWNLVFIYGYWFLFSYISIFPNFIKLICKLFYILKNKRTFNVHWLIRSYTYKFRIQKAYKGMEWNVYLLPLFFLHRKPNYVPWHSSGNTNFIHKIHFLFSFFTHQIECN